MSALVRQKRFVKALLGDANGNATKAAIAAGYSAKTAHASASRLLKSAGVQKALEQASSKCDVSVEDAMQNLGAIASTTPEKVTAADVITANKVILQVKGALQPKQQGSGITVNIGFIAEPGQPPALTIEHHNRDASETLVMASHGAPALPAAANNGGSE